ncbi:SAM-dependent methyltransferase [Nonomuraea lactucae]|uniref:SAM-dependent methyltransferase n=1 Tax=Nonomuraea lactucae TaxID=2249762 RepID=UPI001F05A4FF|nr:SAM-dependent methyltransferase [Nonomuraea lactucae]
MPNASRIYDCLLGGKDGLAADRGAARGLLEVMPGAGTAAQANRDFLGRAVRVLADAGIDQFLELGCGLPTQQNVHQVALSLNPEARVVYVDRDPVVVRHGQALLARDGVVAMVGADLRTPDQILRHPAVTSLLDFSRPVGVLMTAVLQFVPDADRPGEIVAAFRRAMCPGSYLVMSHECRDSLNPRQYAAISGMYDMASCPVALRTRAEILALLDGFDLMEPGLVDVLSWRPDCPSGDHVPGPYWQWPGHATHVLGGVGARVIS